MESEADIAALELMDRAGYNTMGAFTTLQLFAQMERGGRGGGIFASHPGAQDRLKGVTAWMQKNQQPVAADKVVAVPRPWPIVSQVIATGRQLSQRVRALPVQAGDQVARQTLDEANEALGAYEQRPADPAALADLREGLTGAQTFALLSSSLAADPGLARDIQAWGQQAAQAERNQSLDQAARARQFAAYMAQHLSKVGRNGQVDPQAVAALNRVAQAAGEYENALKGNAPAATVQTALGNVLSAAQEWDRQRSVLGLDPRTYGKLLNGLNSELLALTVYEGRATGPDTTASKR
jgi:predicted Zn-dependent protease